MWLTQRGKDAKKTWVGFEYESDPDLRDTEQVPLLEDVEAFMKREVLPYTPDAWIDPAATKIGYEISFTRHFYKPQPLRSLEESRADILALDQETEGMLAEIICGSPRLLPAERNMLPLGSHIKGSLSYRGCPSPYYGQSCIDFPQKMNYWNAEYERLHPSSYLPFWA